MVSTVALVLFSLVLHLHASDTLKKDDENGRPQTTSATLPPPAPPGTTKPSSRAQHSQRGVTSQDEDLLDLMVRIAETPEEWERIHKVLSLIGREKESYESTKYEDKKYNPQNVKGTKNSTENLIRPLQPNSSFYKTTSVDSLESNVITSSTLSPLTITPTLKKQIGVKTSGLGKIEDTDTGWPDFEEAIVKKVKKSRIVDENSIFETDWLEDDWLDPNWNNYLRPGNNNHKPTTSYIPKISYPVSFKTSVSSKKIPIDKGSNVIRSRLYRDPKILEFRLNNPVSLENNTMEHNTSEETNGTSIRSSRPVFVYHRVTTSPQQRRGNNAFIAVSVVRQSPAETPSATTLPPPGPPPPYTYWRIQNPVKDSSLPSHQRKHSHWRQEIHWQHNRGRRHHHTHTHTHH